MERVWLMKRNCSFTPKQVGMFYLSICSFSSLIAGYFVFQGVWMILPFTLLELSVLGIALLVYTRHAADYEKISLHQKELRIEMSRGSRIMQKVWHAPWVKVTLPKPKGRREEQLVLISQGGEELRIGQFIFLERREQLARELQRAINTSIL